MLALLVSPPVPMDANTIRESARKSWRRLRSDVSPSRVGQRESRARLGLGIWSMKYRKIMTMLQNGQKRQSSGMKTMSLLASGRRSCCSRPCPCSAPRPRSSTKSAARAATCSRRRLLRSQVRHRRRVKCASERRGRVDDVIGCVELINLKQCEPIVVSRVLRRHRPRLEARHRIWRDP